MSLKSIEPLSALSTYQQEALEKVSVTISMVSYESDGGSLTIKSMAMDVQVS